MAKAFVVERISKTNEKSYHAPWGWVQHQRDAMRFTFRHEVDAYMASIVLPPGEIKAVEIDLTDERAPPGVKTDYDPYGLRR